MTLQTRSQRDLQEALKLVKSVENEKEDVRKVYGGLCHQFPIMVRTVGLMQTIAYHETKAGKQNKGDSRSDKATAQGKGVITVTGRSRAHALLLEHVAAMLGSQSPAGILSDELAKRDTLQYMHDTRRLLKVWIYFKRFAVSVLKVSDGNSARDE